MVNLFDGYARSAFDTMRVARQRRRKIATQCAQIRNRRAARNQPVACIPEACNYSPHQTIKFSLTY
jgi:hypothetical protein